MEQGEKLMKIYYDDKYDLLYIRFSRQEKEKVQNIEIFDGVVLDVGENGKIVGIEILDASEKYYKNHIDTLPDNLFSFVMAEKFSVDTINTFAKDNFNKAGIEIVIDEISQEDIESNFIIDKKWEKVKEEWRVSTEEIKLIIADHLKTCYD